MPKYIERDAFIAWLKKIRMVDLSDGRGICWVIMEDDFKKAIKNMPESIIHEREVEVVRCRECKYHNKPTCPMRLSFNWTEDNDFCSYGERKDGAE